MFADMHCHLATRDFERDLSLVIDRAKKAQLDFCVAVGTNTKDNLETLDIARRFAFVKPAIGIYPQEAEQLDDDEFEALVSFIAKNKEKICSIGEVGLDYKNTSDKILIDKQKRVFERMIVLSEKTKLPLTIHSRKAENDAFEMVKSSNAKNAVFHCFMGNLAIAKKISDAGHFVSVPTNVVFNAAVQEIAKEIDIHSLVAETDSPFLSPFKGKRNEPAFVVEAVKKIALLKKIKLEDAEGQIFANSKKIISAGARII